MKDHYETALTWAVCAKNVLIRNNRFSPAQLVFVHDHSSPIFLANALPAQDYCKNFDIALHIATLKAASEALITTESMNKLKLALCKNIHPSRSQFNIEEEL